MNIFSAIKKNRNRHVFLIGLLASALFFVLITSTCVFSAVQVIDNTFPVITVEYDENIDTSSLIWSLNKTDGAEDEEVEVEFINYVTENNSFRFKPLYELFPGDYYFFVIAKDVLGNGDSEGKLFTIELPLLSLVISKPRFGIFKDESTGLWVRTNRYATCKYDYKPRFNPATNGFEDMEWSFIQEDEYNYSDVDFRDYTAYVYMVCQDKFGEETQLETQLRWDPQRPIIESIKGENVYDPPIKSLITVKTSEETICKYSKEEISYDMMTSFDNYENTKESSFLLENTQVLWDYELQNGAYNKFYVVCEDKPGSISETGEVTIHVDLNAPSNITVVYPNKRYIESEEIELQIETNRVADCYYGNTSKTTDMSRFSSVPMKTHVSPTLNLDQGTYTYYFFCSYPTQLTPNNEKSAQVTFSIDSKEPKINYFNITNLQAGSNRLLVGNDEIRLSWEAEDNESGIDYCEYRLLQEKSSTRTSSTTTIISWTNTSDSSEVLTSPDGDNFPDGTYYAELRCYDEAGLSADEDSNKVEIKTGPPPSLCTNGLLDKDNSETDTDCGGRYCPRCVDEKTCEKDTDCESNWCDNETMKCKSPSCDDNVVNGKETDEDCGGGDCDKCSLDKKCKKDADCESGLCDSQRCAELKPCFNLRQDDDEADMDCGGVCDLKCEFGDRCLVNSDCITGFCLIEENEEGNAQEGKCDYEPNDKDDDGIIDEEDNCPDESNSDQEDLDEDGDGDVCDDDIDGDGMDNDWEESYGLNPRDDSDAFDDIDGDGLSNIEEFKDVYEMYGERTYPDDPDTDRDNWKDGDEFNKGFSPVDAEDHPASFVLFFLILLILIIINYMAGYYLYRRKSEFEEKEERNRTDKERREFAVRAEQDKKRKAAIMMQKQRQMQFMQQQRQMMLMKQQKQEEFLKKAKAKKEGKSIDEIDDEAKGKTSGGLDAKVNLAKEIKKDTILERLGKLKETGLDKLSGFTSKKSSLSAQEDTKKDTNESLEKLRQSNVDKISAFAKKRKESDNASVTSSKDNGEDKTKGKEDKKGLDKLIEQSKKKRTFDKLGDLKSSEEKKGAIDNLIARKKLKGNVEGLKEVAKGKKKTKNI